MRSELMQPELDQNIAVMIQTVVAEVFSDETTVIIKYKIIIILSTTLPLLSKY